MLPEEAFASTSAGTVANFRLTLAESAFALTVPPRRPPVDVTRRGLDLQRAAHARQPDLPGVGSQSHLAAAQVGAGDVAGGDAGVDGAADAAQRVGEDRHDPAMVLLNGLDVLPPITTSTWSTAGLTTLSGSTATLTKDGQQKGAGSGRSAGRVCRRLPR